MIASKPSPRQWCWTESLGLALTLLILPAMGCSPSSQPAPPQPKGGSPTQTRPAGNDVLELVFPYGSEKQKWIDAVTKEFNDGDHRTTAKNRIWVRTVPLGSGELITEIQEGRLKGHLASPASSVFIELGNAESKTRTGKPLVGETRNLVVSPVVVAMWKPMAEALGWGKRPIGWADILQIAKDEQGWAKYNYPQWGRFKFGHTHPEYSNSGIISVFAEVYAGAGKLKGLTAADVARPEVGQFLHGIEESVVHYGSSTGFFGRRMFLGGPQYLSAAVLYENMVIESYGSDPAPPLPVVAIYPKEGTFWSDHPVGVVQREWVDDEHRQAAEEYIAFLTAPEQQKRAMEFGFRPADVGIPLGDPINAAHGVDPKQPETTLEVPSATVMNAVVDLWKQQKKHANVVLAIDISGSMQGKKIDNAKIGAKQLVEILDKGDTLSLMSFNDNVAWAGQGLSMATDRQVAAQDIDSLFASDGTALYEAIAMAHRYLVAKPASDKISAIVVLSDGEDTSSRMRLEELLKLVETNVEGRGVRIFTIGYGSDARPDVLGKISEVTQAKYYSGTPENIREVFKEISTFF